MTIPLQDLNQLGNCAFLFVQCRDLYDYTHPCPIPSDSCEGSYTLSPEYGAVSAEEARGVS